MKKFFKAALEHLICHATDLFYLLWAALLALFYKGDKISFESTVVAMLVTIVCYQYVNNMRND